MTDPCPQCDHDWHGLRCQGRAYRYPDNHYITGPCGCRTSWTDPDTEETL